MVCGASVGHRLGGGSLGELPQRASISQARSDAAATVHRTTMAAHAGLDKIRDQLK
jgi:hypothetical protein